MAKTTTEPSPAPETLTADVIISGAGIAGATLALALKSAGLEPILIDPLVFEAQIAPTFDGRATAGSMRTRWPRR